MGRGSTESYQTIGGLRLWHILSLAVLQEIQKDNVNQAEIVVLTEVSFVEDACNESCRRPEQAFQTILWNHVLTILQGRNKTCNRSHLNLAACNLVI